MDEVEWFGSLGEDPPGPRPEARETARAALLARFEATPSRQRRASRRRRRVRLILAASGCAAILGAAMLIFTSRDVTTKAYAVDPRPSGLVTVFVRSLEDGEGLQRSLREAGVPAVVEFTNRNPFRGRPDIPPQARNLLPALVLAGECFAKLPGVGITLTLGYPESLTHLASLDPSLQPTLQRGMERGRETFMKEIAPKIPPKRRKVLIQRIEEAQQLRYEGKSPQSPVPPVPPFTFIPTEDLLPPVGEEGVTFIIDPEGLGAGETLHILTTRGGLQSMTAYTENAFCSVGGGWK